jgi:hypothetical protein
MSETTLNARRGGAAFFVMLGIPAFAVLASILLVFEAVRSAEPELPASYAVEGRALDADFAAARRAGEAGLALELDMSRDGQLRLTAQAGDDTALPPTLSVHLTHTTLPMRDRQTVLRRDATGAYIGRILPLETGRWWLQIDGTTESGAPWRLRSRFRTPLEHLSIKS